MTDTTQSATPQPTLELIAIRHALALIADLDALSADAGQRVGPARRGTVGEHHCLRCDWRWDSQRTAANGERILPSHCARCRSMAWRTGRQAAAWRVGEDDAVGARWAQHDQRERAAYVRERAASLVRIADLVAKEMTACGRDGLLVLLRPEVAAYLTAQRAADAASEAALAEMALTPELLAQRGRTRVRQVKAKKRRGSARRIAKADVSEVKAAIREMAAEVQPPKIEVKIEPVEWASKRFGAEPPAIADDMFVNTPSHDTVTRHMALRGPVLAPAPPSMDDLPTLVTTPIDGSDQR